MPLFRGNIDPRCGYCKHGIRLVGEDKVGCLRHGVMAASAHCRSFRYDPFKRVPSKPVKLRQNYAEEDFTL